ncbi:YwqG family protein [Microbacteriaceae bacterium 4G12]
MTKQIEALIDKHHLTHLKAELVPYVFEYLKIVPKKTDILPIGSSKLGGIPDFPKTMEYPTYNEKPLTFIGQFNLEDLQKTGIPNKLPQAGMLYFFYFDDFEDEAYYEMLGNPDEKNGWRVIFYEGAIEDLIPVTETDSQYPACHITFERRHSLPQIFIEDEQDEDNFLQLLEELSPDEYNNHQALGVPFSIQNEVFEEAEDYVGAKAEDMTLLLQIDSDEENLHMMWGDSGMLYFCIANKDLEEQNFQNVCCIMQCL